MIINQIGGNGNKPLPPLTTPGKASDVLSGKQFIDGNGEVVTGTIPSKGSSTITPGVSNQTILSGQYLSGTQTILGDTDLKPENIRDGVNIFNVVGNYKVQKGMFTAGMFGSGMFGGAPHRTVTFPIDVRRLIAFRFNVYLPEISQGAKLLFVNEKFGAISFGDQVGYSLTRESRSANFSFGNYGWGDTPNAFLLIDGSTSNLWNYSDGIGEAYYLYI